MVNHFFEIMKLKLQLGFPGGSGVKINLPTHAEDVRVVGSIPGLGRSPGVGNGNQLQYSCLANPIGAWQTIIHGVTRESDSIQQQLEELVTWALRAGFG